MKKLLGMAFALVAFPAWAGDLPDPQRTPGRSNPNVTSENIDETICVPGFTKKIRPPTSYTNKLKKKQIEEYGISDRTIYSWLSKETVSAPSCV
jgi:hypothetical protein